MDPTAPALLFSLLAALFTGAILLCTRRTLAAQSPHPTFRDAGLGLFLGATLLGLALATATHSLSSPTAGDLACSAFLTALGLALFLPAIRFHIQLTPTGLLIQTTFRRRRFIPYSDLTALRYRSGSDTHLLCTRTTRPYTLSNLLCARPDLLAALAPHVPSHARPNLRRI